MRKGNTNNLYSPWKHNRVRHLEEAGCGRFFPPLWHLHSGFSLLETAVQPLNTVWELSGLPGAGADCMSFFGASKAHFVAPVHYSTALLLFRPAARIIAHRGAVLRHYRGSTSHSHQRKSTENPVLIWDGLRWKESDSNLMVLLLCFISEHKKTLWIGVQGNTKKNYIRRSMFGLIMETTGVLGSAMVLMALKSRTKHNPWSKAFILEKMERSRDLTLLSSPHCL